MDTDYTRFALMLSLRQVSRQTVIRVSLLGEPRVLCDPLWHFLGLGGGNFEGKWPGHLATPEC
jgi:hypothetical protein